MERGIVIFSGYNQRAVIAFLRVVSKYRSVKYFIIAASDDDPILLSDYAKRVFCIRENKQLDLGELCSIFSCIKEQEGMEELVVAPSTEALNRFFLANRDLFAGLQVTMPIVEKALYEQISDKDSFYEMCIGNGLDVPVTLEDQDAFSTPFVAKPKHYFSANNKVFSPVLVTNQKEYDYFVENYHREDFTLQEYVVGRSLYLLYYFAKNGDVYSYSQENYAQQPGGKSILVAQSSDVHNKTISESYITMLKEKGYFGFIMIEVRERDGRYYMIEANPRFWGPSQLFVDAGVPFFDLFLRDCGVISDIEACEIKMSKYFWGTGFKGKISNSVAECWYEDARQHITADISNWEKWDIYNRKDTLEIYELEKKKQRIGTL